MGEQVEDSMERCDSANFYSVNSIQIQVLECLMHLQAPHLSRCSSAKAMPNQVWETPLMANYSIHHHPIRELVRTAIPTKEWSGQERRVPGFLSCQATL